MRPLTIRFDTLVTGAFVENGYALYDDTRDDCVLIDPGDEPKKWLAWCDAAKRTPIAILGTHAHLDHVGAVAAIQDQFDAAYLLHRDEVPMLDHLATQCAMFGMPPIPNPRVTSHVAHGQELTLAGVDVRAIATPGHTPGGMSYHVPKLDTVFTGDTLFAGSIGRTDLPGGDHEQLLESLRNLVLALDDDVTVAPGHGPTTSIYAERTGNPFFRVDR